MSPAGTILCEARFFVWVKLASTSTRELVRAPPPPTVREAPSLCLKLSSEAFFCKELAVLASSKVREAVPPRLSESRLLRRRP